VKVIEAKWEKINLGVVAYEISVEESDTLIDLKTTLDKLVSEYTVVKIPTYRTELLFETNSLKLTFVEMVTKCHYTGQTPALNGIHKRIIESLTCQEISPENQRKLLVEVENGLFKADRVAIDPVFGIEKSSARYAGWIRDEVDLGATIYEVTKRSDFVGFFLLRKIDGLRCVSNLAGLIGKFQNSGIGYALNYFEIEMSSSIGASSVVSTYSSNNRGASTIHMSMGYVLDSQNYVYIRH